MKKILRAHLLAAVALAGMLLTACGGDGGTKPPTPGALVVSLNTPASDDGAVLLTITGPGITSVQAASSTHRVFWRLVTPEEMRVIVIGQLASGPLLTLNVADVNRVSSYNATIGEVAAANDQIRTSTTGYSLSLTRSGS